MNTPPFTARNVAKFIAKSLVAYKTAQLTADTVAEHTRYESDDFVVDIGSKCVGWYVSEKLEPVTDAIVDRSADFVTEQRNKLRNKKDDKNDEK